MKSHPRSRSRQRRALIITCIFTIASSLGSAIYYKVPGGLAFPFVAPILLLPSNISSHPRWWMAAVAIAMIIAGIGTLAWHRCRPALTYTFIAGVILLVVLSVYITHLLWSLSSI